MFYLFVIHHGFTPRSWKTIFKRLFRRHVERPLGMRLWIGGHPYTFSFTTQEPAVFRIPGLFRLHELQDVQIEVIPPDVDYLPSFSILCISAVTGRWYDAQDLLRREHENRAGLY